MTAITQNEGLQTWAEIASLKDVVLKFMAGNASPLAVDRSITYRLTRGDNADLVAQIAKQLIETPSLLKNACEKTTLATESTDIRFDQRRRLKEIKFSSTCVRNQLHRRIGFFGYAYDFRSFGAIRCPYHQSDWGSWSYSLSVLLLPIVQ